MLILTTDEFQRQPSHVLAQLLSGKAFLLIEDDVPVARLIGLTTEPKAAQHLSDDWTQPLNYALTVLDSEAVSRILGLTHVSFLLLKKEQRIPTQTHSKLLALAEALAQQRGFWPLGRIRRWWRSPNPELDGYCPLDYLARPWNLGDARSSVLFDLIRRESLI